MTRLTRISTRGLQTVALLLVPLLAAHATTYHVSTTGNDANDGTPGAPFLTIARAMVLPSSVFKPGDTVLVKGGIYASTAPITIAANGSAAARYYLLAYPGERPVLDFSAQTVQGGNRAILLKGSYWHIKGLDVRGAGDNGMNISGSNNTVEFCSFYENRDSGLQLGGGASNNRIINCDSFFNVDTGQGNADGFAPKLDVGSGNYFYGCRSWQNSDDGWDGYMRGANDVTTTLESCWCFNNGFLKDGSPSRGNGNGYKTGGSDTRDLMHNMILNKCVAFDNRVKGFDQNNNRGSITIFNGTAYRNGTNYAIGDTLARSRGKILTVKNCVALGPYGTLHASAIQQTNSWLAPFSVVTGSDFVSVDTAGVRGARKADGSLPDISFLVPAPSSQLVDAGTDVGLPYNGAAPDLGAFETLPATAGATDGFPEGPGFAILGNYPNPFNASTVVSFHLPVAGNVRLVVYDLLGREVRVLVEEQKAPGNYVLRFDGANLATGAYICRLTAGAHVRTRSILLLR